MLFLADCSMSRRHHCPSTWSVGLKVNCTVHKLLTATWSVDVVGWLLNVKATSLSIHLISGTKGELHSSQTIDSYLKCGCCRLIGQYQGHITVHPLDQWDSRSTAQFTNYWQLLEVWMLSADWSISRPHHCPPTWSVGLKVKCTVHKLLTATWSVDVVVG